ncbi:MAG: hypothetical protein R8G34_02575 [Paracoccaceae bacterium]|nr:hypothetical protein [Paracoccaceae bacterium]
MTHEGCGSAYMNDNILSVNATAVRYRRFLGKGIDFDTIVSETVATSFLTSPRLAAHQIA